MLKIDPAELILSQSKKIYTSILFTIQLSLRDNPLVVRFVSNMTLNPPSLLEHAGRAIKIHRIPYGVPDLPTSLVEYLNSAHHCVNPKCKGSGHAM